MKKRVLSILLAATFTVSMFAGATMVSAAENEATEETASTGDFNITVNLASEPQTMESTAAWRIHRRRNISFQYDSLSASAYLRIRYRNSRKQCLGVWMQRIAVQLIAFCKLNHCTQIHNTDTMRNMS